MSDCECLSNCPFFAERMSDMPSTTELLKHRYCHVRWDTCARYRVFVEFSRDAVPDDLFPDQDLIAEKVLMELRKG